MGGVQQRPQHPLGITRSEGADVGVEQADDLSVLAGDAQALPHSPPLAGGASQVEPETCHGRQHLAHGGAVGPVHAHWEGHVGEEALCFCNILRTVG